MNDPSPPSNRVLAIDWGEKRIGLALSDPSRTIAQPLATLTRRSGKRFPLQQLKSHIDAHRPSHLVVGLPLEGDGSDGPAARAARELAALLGQKTGLPVTLLDERMSTARALSAVRDLGGGTRGRRGDVDQLAATVLLQSYLDTRPA
ncbi:MAG TPA: Holliday junction resolvase RuvX [Gemmatimonadales bacterium]